MRHPGDLRYSFVTWNQDVDTTRGLLGYGPSSSDPRTGEVLDFFGGAADLRNRILRHVGVAFSEDPLRVLRGMQLAGRFGLTATPDTIALCRSIKSGYPELAGEGVGG